MNVFNHTKMVCPASVVQFNFSVTTKQKRLITFISQGSSFLNMATYCLNIFGRQNSFKALEANKPAQVIFTSFPHRSVPIIATLLRTPDLTPQAAPSLKIHFTLPHRYIPFPSPLILFLCALQVFNKFLMSSMKMSLLRRFKSHCSTQTFNCKVNNLISISLSSYLS